MRNRVLPTQKRSGCAFPDQALSRVTGSALPGRVIDVNDRDAPARAGRRVGSAAEAWAFRALRRGWRQAGPLQGRFGAPRRALTFAPSEFTRRPPGLIVRFGAIRRSCPTTRLPGYVGAFSAFLGDEAVPQIGPVDERARLRLVGFVVPHILVAQSTLALVWIVVSLLVKPLGCDGTLLLKNAVRICERRMMGGDPPSVAAASTSKSWSRQHVPLVPARCGVSISGELASASGCARAHKGSLRVCPLVVGAAQQSKVRSGVALTIPERWLRA